MVAYTQTQSAAHRRPGRGWGWVMEEAVVFALRAVGLFFAVYTVLMILAAVGLIVSCIKDGP